MKTVRPVRYSERKWRFNTIFSGNMTNDNLLALKQCQNVATQLSRVPSPAVHYKWIFDHD